jgi:hypothetical protein
MLPLSSGGERRKRHRQETTTVPTAEKPKRDPATRELLAAFTDMFAAADRVLTAKKKFVAAAQRSAMRLVDGDEDEPREGGDHAE